ncbi:MAG: hypothetical protein HQK81_06760 [Desulfovibrionaceae bacterium]|nr:hypothetical protein [Desulfovibrionaceae bacterium]MBF0513751.1 hypothetical protein [Desulfovibrionaceae bacterium]
MMRRDAALSACADALRKGTIATLLAAALLSCAAGTPALAGECAESSGLAGPEATAPEAPQIADAAETAGTDDAAQIKTTLDRYAKAVNERDLPGLLAVYAQEASVNATIGGVKRFYSLDDYARALPVKFKEWEAVGARIDAFEVVSLRIQGDTASVVVKAKGRRYFLSGTLEGGATLVKSRHDWKILKDDL